jgi:hypothetical protein
MQHRRHTCRQKAQQGKESCARRVANQVAYRANAVDLELTNVGNASDVMSKPITCLLCAFAGVVLLEQPALADDPHWSFEVLIGDAYNFGSRTRVRHETLGRLSIEGDFETRGVEGPLHYAWGVTRWNDDKAWELQLLHHNCICKIRQVRSNHCP